MNAGRKGDNFVLEPAGSTPQPVTFHSFLLGLAASALIHLGVKPHPETGELKKDLGAAREVLDLLALLHEKTRGNLSKDEERLIESLLGDLRFTFVEASRA